MKVSHWHELAERQGFIATTECGRTVYLVRLTGPRGGPKWVLEVDGVQHELGRRASFDRAEGLLLELGK